MPGQAIKCLTVASVLLVSSSQTLAQRGLKDIPNPDPEIERKSFIVADGFEVNLFAADPKIAKPIQMNFDPQGRLWIAGSETYPHIKPGEKMRDRILVVEDTDNDGVADKTTVFADGLLIPTGVVPGDGGCYVANSTELLHLKDTDGDLKADETRVVLSGFGTEDTHHILHTLRWGPDGMMYLNQSIYIHSHIETPWGVRRLNAGGIWQFRPETMRLDVFARGWVNTWGHQFDQYGQSFVTDGAGGEGINYCIPGAAYPTAQGVPRIFHGLNPGSPKYCGLEIVSGRHLPDDWQNNLITNDFRGNRVCRFVVSDDGSGYAAREQAELIKTKHVAFRPIDLRMGPDGAIYIADWYNPIIQHGEVDFRDPRRDHTHGRIWRLTYTKKDVLPKPKLVDASVPEVLGHLTDPEGWTRRQAKRVLKERGAKAVLPELKMWLSSLDSSDPQIERHRLEGLWVYQSLDVPEPELLDALLTSSVPEVRAAAVRVLQHWFDRVDAGIHRLSAAIADDHPRVRLEAVRVLGNVDSTTGVEVAMQALNKPVDRFLDYALWLTAWENRDSWLPLVEAGKLTFGGDVEQMTFALTAVGSRSIIPRLLDSLKRGELSADQLRSTSSLLVNQANPNELRVLFDVLAADTTKPAVRNAILDVLVNTATATQKKPAGDLSKIAGFLVAEHSTAIREQASRCIGLWKQQSLLEALASLARNDKENDRVRIGAIDGLTALGGDDAGLTLTQVAANPDDPAIQQAAIAGLSRVDIDAGAEMAAFFLKTTNQDPARVIGAFLNQKGAAAKLTATLSTSKIDGDVARLALRAVDSTGRDFPGLKAAIAKAGGIQGTGRQFSPAQMQSLVAQVRENGDAARGEAIFRRKGLNCLKCHAIGGAGGRVGPDLTSIGGSAQVDYLIDSLVKPNAKIKENYHTLVVITDRGRSYSGVKVRQTDKDLILRDGEDKEVRIPLKSIDEQIEGKSLMPSGLIDKLTDAELVDLVAFLSQLGKVGGMRVSRERIVRRWQSLIPSPEAQFRIRRTRLASVVEDDPAFVWQSAYSRVDGTFPLDDVRHLPFRAPFQKQPTPLAVLRFELTVGTPGKVALVTEDVRHLSIWLDGAPLEPAASIPVDLKTGRHRVTVVADFTKRKGPVRFRIQDVEGSPAQVQLVGGK